MSRAPGSYSGLTAMQAELLSYLRTRDAAGSTPSFEEMRVHLNQASKSGIARLLTALEERGYVRRLHDRARALEVFAERQPVEDRASPKRPLSLYPLSDLLVEMNRRGYRVALAA